MRSRHACGRIPQRRSVCRPRRSRPAGSSRSGARPSPRRRQPPPCGRRPRTRWPNLFLAGDWTATGLPATIEGAIRSGQRAAELIVERLGGRVAGKPEVTDGRGSAARGLCGASGSGWSREGEEHGYCNASTSSSAARCGRWPGHGPGSRRVADDEAAVMRPRRRRRRADPVGPGRRGHGAAGRSRLPARICRGRGPLDLDQRRQRAAGARGRRAAARSRGVAASGQLRPRDRPWRRCCGRATW